MARSKAASVDAYLAELPPERRAVVREVREMVLRHLPAGYRETVNWGMISYEIPLERFPKTYNGEPLSYVGLAAQKSHYALYLMGAYAFPEQQEALREAFARAGKKMNMGKSCLRFKRTEDLPLADLGKIIGSLKPEDYIARYEAAKSRRT